MTNEVDLDREYMKAVLGRLDICLEREIRRWQSAGQDPTDRFRGLRISDQEALALSRLGIGVNWGTNISLPGSEEQDFERMSNRALKRIEEIEDLTEKNHYPLRLKRLTEIFGLSSFEWWALILCLAPALDLRYERIFGFLQDDITLRFPDVNLMLLLLLEGDHLTRLESLRYFDPQAPLRLYRLILPVEENGRTSKNILHQSFQAAPGVVDWLLDNYSPAASIGGTAELFPVPSTVDEVSEAAEIFKHEHIPTREIFDSLHPFVSFHGNDLLQQELTARQIAAGMKKPLLRLKFTLGGSIEEALDLLGIAVRDARMLGALLYLQGIDFFINEDGCLLPDCYQMLRLKGEGVLLSSRAPFKFNPEMPGNDYPLMHVPFEDLSTKDRIDLWKALLEDASEGLPEKDIAGVAGQFSLTSGQIIAAASTAMASALQDERLLVAADLYSAARFHSGHHLAELAQKIEPRYTWSDLVLPETPMSMLQEMVNMVKTRSLVLDDWGLGRKLTSSTGISALFSGPPGTGKTLAAQIMANQLGIDLYRIDLSTVVSKYIGETEKNLERIFSDAAQSNAILFFDEADTIFGKRSEVKDAHDRYANIEVGYLLQRMESYTGVSILATNLRANLDEAFTRRLQFIINFPFPDEEYRLKIWKVLMPPSMPCADDLDLALMAERFKIAGGSIRNIIVSAAFFAASNGGKVEMTHLLHGARRELQKIGKLLNESDFVYSGNGDDHV